MAFFGQGLNSAFDLLLNSRMNDGVQSLSRIGVGEDPRAKLAPVNARIGYDIVPESRNDAGFGVSAGKEKFVPDRVRIEDGEAQLLESARCHRFSASRAARKPDDASLVFAAHHVPFS